MFAPIRTVAPDEQPVSRSQAKAQLQIDGTNTDWDDLLDAYIEAATAHLDGWSGILGRCLVTQTWTQSFECFEREFDLPFPDVQTVTVEYRDTSGTWQTFDAANYALQQEVGGSCVELLTTAAIPATSWVREDRVRITMVVGYGAAAAVPKPLCQAILLTVGHWFANRETVNVGNIVSELPFGATALVAPYRRVGV